MPQPLPSDGTESGPRDAMPPTQSLMAKRPGSGNDMSQPSLPGGTGPGTKDFMPQPLPHEQKTWSRRWHASIPAP